MVTEIDTDGQRTTLTCTATGGLQRVTVPAVADTSAAHRWLGLFRRIDRVVIVDEGGAQRAQVRGCRHRLPVTSAVALPVALGLAALGVPTSLGRGAG